MILYMPTAIVSALTDFIYKKAKEFNCYEALMALLQERQFDKTFSALTHMSWVPTDLKLPENTFSLPLRETVFQFDNQKLGYLCFIGRRSTKGENGELGTHVSMDSFSKRNKQVVNYLNKLSEKQSYHVLSLFVLSETGQEFLFAWPKSQEDHFSLSLSYSELDAIAYSEDSNSQTLWKFAKTLNRTSSSFRIETFGGTLDTFVAYKSNNGSFFDANEPNPIGGSLFIPVGLSNDFLRKIQTERDEHAALIFYKRQIAYTKRSRRRSRTSITTARARAATAARRITAAPARSTSRTC